MPGLRHAQAEAKAALEGLELVRSSQNSTFQNVNMTGAKFQTKMLVLGASCESFAQFPRHHGSIRMAQGYVSLCVCCI